MRQLNDLDYRDAWDCESGFQNPRAGIYCGKFLMQYRKRFDLKIVY
jgi:hypothetical protein